MIVSESIPADPPEQLRGRPVNARGNARVRRDRGPSRSNPRAAPARRRGRPTRRRGGHATRGLDPRRFRGRLPYRSFRNIGREVDVTDFLERNVPEQFLTEFHAHFSPFVCPHCNAYLWEKENKNACCVGGKVRLPRLPPPPDELLPLYDVRGSAFLKKARAYNNLFAMASLGCSEIRQDGFSPTFTIQGKMYHRIGALLPSAGESPKFAQLYFHDTENQTSNRMNTLDNLDHATVMLIEDAIVRHNPYISSLKYGLELIQQSPDVRLVLHADSKNRPSDSHARTYNLPTASEVGALLPGENAGNLDVILHPRDGPLQRINTVHRSYDPLHYVLMFPRGEDGFQLGMKTSHGKTLTALNFYSYRFRTRENEWNTVMRCRRLTQQYAVDSWAKIEGARLDWVRRNQSEIRAEKYNGLLDAQAEGDLANAGRRIILPPTIYGSPRFYSEAFQDSMCGVRKCGKPHLFATATCNPNWEEIVNELNDGETSADRPDLCARVFKIKIDQILADITQNHIFGEVVAYTAVVEFQKRGLPHVHIVVTLADSSRPRTPEEVDKIVSAEIPDRASNPRLYDIVTTNNLHGPCGNVNRGSVCMVGEGQERKCSKSFPKPLCAQTVLSETNYPQYRRRSPEDGGQIHQKNIGTTANPILFDMDNSWVVPYNPYLSLRYNSHINVEIVYSVQCVKYLFKYITKGQDRVVFDLSQADEVENYVNARYISASEAYWRIYGFSLHHRYPPVMKLECHLPGEQVEFFADGEEQNVLDRGPRLTKLEAYFQTNATDPLARNILYPDFPDHYTWVSGQRKWKRRLRGKMMGRIPMINLNPHQAELFYLRMLLHNKAGATSFEDLRTVDGVLASSFQDACVKLGLLESDDSLDRVMEEAASIRFGNQLRDVFANLLIYNRPSDPLSFWNRHRDKLVEDYVRQSDIGSPTELMYNQALQYLSDRFELDDLSYDSFNLPPLSRRPDNHVSVPRVIQDETSYDSVELAASLPERVTTLNPEQRAVYDEVLHSVHNEQGRVFALQASGGTGKTYTLNLVLDTIRSENSIALGTALSGIAATLLNNGRTLHSRCKIPLKVGNTSHANFTKRDATGKLMQRAKILIIDEVGMGNKHVFEALDRTLRYVRDCPRMFGGLTVLLAADWRQGLPVVPKGSRGQIVDACLRSSYIWNNVEVFRLDTNMRILVNGAAEEFANYLISCGDGELPIQQELGPFKVEVPDDIRFKGNLDGLIDWVFPNMTANSTEPQWAASRGIICPTNVTVDTINSKVMGRFPGEERVYSSFDSVGEEEAHLYPVEFLNTLCPSGMPPHKLSLKVGCPIMLMRNLEPSKGHCNGSKYYVTKLHDNIIEAEVAQGAYQGNKIFIPRIPIKPSDSTYPFELNRKQFPVRPSFAITSNKAQGQTLRRVGIYLDRDFFSHGQYYVAQSRVGQPDALKVLVMSRPHRGSVYTSNVVYKEVLYVVH